MFVKDFIEVLQSLPPDARILIVTPEECAELEGAVYYKGMNELVILGEDTQIEFDDEVAEGNVQEFGTVNYFFDKGITEENFEEEEDSEMNANADQVFTPEIVEAIINEARMKEAIGITGKEDKPLALPAPLPPPNPNSCEEDA